MRSHPGEAKDLDSGKEYGDGGYTGFKRELDRKYREKFGRRDYQGRWTEGEDDGGVIQSNMSPAERKRTQANREKRWEYYATHYQERICGQIYATSGWDWDPNIWPI